MKIMGLWGNKYIYICVLTHVGKYYTPQPPLLLPLYEGYVSVRRNVTYIYCGNHRQGVICLYSLLKVYGGSELPNIQLLNYLKYGRVLDPAIQ